MIKLPKNSPKAKFSTSSSPFLVAVILPVLFVGIILAPGMAQKPNIIFILADDMGYGEIGSLWQNSRSGPKLITPELDAMAKQGMTLSRHYAPAPVCAPSRASLLTGLHQGHANVRDNQFDKAIEDNFNIANTLRIAGYHTSLVGKYGIQGNGSSAATWPAYPTKRGFDYFYGYVRHVDGHQHYPANNWPLGDNAVHRTPKQLWENDEEVSSGLDKCFTQDLFTAKAKQIIKQRTEGEPDKPFFLYLAYDTPHAALQLPTVAYPSGGGISGGLQWIGTSGKMINTAAGTIDSYRDPQYVAKGLSEGEVRQGTMISRLDRSVGDLLQTLKDLKIENRTLVFFTSDNGPANGTYMSGEGYEPTTFQSYGPLQGMKRDVFEGGIRVPTLAWGPTRILADKVNSTPSQFHDWLPTFLDFAGQERPARADGVSLKPTLTGSGNQEASRVYVEYTVNGAMPKFSDFPTHGGASRVQGQAVYLDGYKGIRNNMDSHAEDFLIYDTENDAAEKKNLSGTSPAFTALQRRMKDAVLQMRIPDASAPRPYDSEPVPAIPVSAIEPGLLTSRYKGAWPWVPAFDVMPALQSSIETKPDVAHVPRPGPAGLLYSGYLSVPTTGVWTFFVKADKAAVLRIHDILVLDADYGYTGTEKKQELRLEKGLHPIRLYYRSEGTAPSLALQWSGPGTTKTAVPASRFFIREGTVSLHPFAPGMNLDGKDKLGKPHSVDGRLRSLQERESWWKPIFLHGSP